VALEAEVDSAIEEANAKVSTAERLAPLQKAVAMVEPALVDPALPQPGSGVDRTLAFEPRADRYLRYAEVGVRH